MSNFNNILLFGGETKNENMPVGFYASIALLPLRGKPVIWWQLDNLKKHNINNFIIVVCKENKKLIDYINNVLSESFKIELVLINKNKNILSSLKYGLLQADLNKPTRVILGDTYIPSSINTKKDVLYTSKEFSTSENWCLVEKQERGLYFYDKQSNIDLNNKEVLVGYYSFSDTKCLLNCCINSRLLLKKEISTALIAYQKEHKLSTQLISDWYDLGHTSGIIKTKSILFNARDFNSISVDSKMGTLTKTSTKIQKLEDEAYWFNNLPEELKILTPRFINFEKDNKIAKLTQELYGYPSLQELYVSGIVNIEDWKYILELLFDLHKNFEKYTKNADDEMLNWLYWDKTIERLENLKEQNKFWEKIINSDKETINGKEYRGISSLIPDIKNYASQISHNQKQTIIHGDYCFSNILFDSSNYCFKLIDPRGRMNKDATIYGDPRYDIAKLRHSVCGLYDFIVQDLFRINETEKGFEYKILSSTDYSSLEKIFDKLTLQNGYSVNEIKFIEGLLFLSMLPLHKDNLNRQKAFYIKSIELLNESLIEGNIYGRKEVANMY